MQSPPFEAKRVAARYASRCNWQLILSLRTTMTVNSGIYGLSQPTILCVWSFTPLDQALTKRVLTP
jgi:hypothetical protein